MSSLRQTLILVEDNPDDERLSLRAISKCGIPCEVKVIRDGGQAIEELLSADTGTPDLIVLDFHLPSCNGLEILRALRKNPKTKHLPIVMLSSLGMDTDIEACLNEGANSFVQKPLDPQLYIDNVALVARYWLVVDKRPELSSPSRGI